MDLKKQHNLEDVLTAKRGYFGDIPGSPLSGICSPHLLLSISCYEIINPGMLYALTAF